MTDPVPAHDPTPPAMKTKVNVAVMLIVAAVFVTVPVLVFAGIYLLLDQTSFEAVDELKANELESVRVRMLNLPRGPQNRPDPAGDETLRPEENTPDQIDPDLGPVLLTRQDFDVLLAPLRDATRIETKDWPAAVFLGEIQVRLLDGRPGTIRLYRAPDKPGDPRSPSRVYFKVKGNLYRGPTVKDLRTAAEPSAARGIKGK